MKKILVMPCVLALCLLTACFDFCGFNHGKANTTYTFSYSNPNGTTTSGEFRTNEYGQATFDTNEGIDCGKVTITEKNAGPALEESQV